MSPRAMNFRGRVSLERQARREQVQPGNPSDKLHEHPNDGQSGIRGNSYTMGGGDQIQRLLILERPVLLSTETGPTRCPRA